MAGLGAALQIGAEVEISKETSEHQVNICMKLKREGWGEVRLKRRGLEMCVNQVWVQHISREQQDISAVVPCQCRP